MTSWAFETAVRTLWSEARGEPLIGQQAVAHVLCNRLRSGQWGQSFEEVCRHWRQFSCWNLDPGHQDPNWVKVARLPDADPELSALRSVMLNAYSNGDDPTGGALYYYANSMANPPDWAANMISCGQFGNQKFFK